MKDGSLRRSPRKSGLILILATVSLGLAGCAQSIPSSAGIAASSSVAAGSTKSSPTEVLAPVISDGTWEHGKFGFGAVVTNRLSDYEIVVLQPPTITWKSESGTLTTLMSVKRVKELTPNSEIAKDLSIFFVPGDMGYPKYDERFGKLDERDINCDNKSLPMNGSTNCRISFSGTEVQLRNSYWTINRDDVAAWPGQVGSG